MNISPFLKFGFPRLQRGKPNFKKGEKGFGVAFTQAATCLRYAPAGLALGDYPAAPGGAPEAA